MNHSHANRFRKYYEDNQYTTRKNYLYNYHLRKMAVEKNLQSENTELILEMGSGIASVMMKSRDIIYSDLSFSAIQLFKHYMEKDIILSQTALVYRLNPELFLTPSVQRCLSICGMLGRPLKRLPEL